MQKEKKTIHFQQLSTVVKEQKKACFYCNNLHVACIYNNALGLQELSECMLHGI